MSELVRTNILRTGDDACFHITLSAPRSNALNPDVLEALVNALDQLEASGASMALLTGGRNFSTGGDVARFYEAATRGNAKVYARSFVPLLQECVSRMIEMPVIFASAARGATTGGSAGFLFAADLVVVAPDAFVQPYYTTVGFAPDGGWTAILPERVGAAETTNWLLSDERRTSSDLFASGFAVAIDAHPESRALKLLEATDTTSALISKALVWDEERVALAKRRLVAETEAFMQLIDQDETQSKMADFLFLEKTAANV